MTKVRVWLGHDGYRDPDENLGALVGAAQARVVAKGSGGAVAIGGIVFGDTVDGAQYHMLHPLGTTPAAHAGDWRFLDIPNNRIAAGNYDFWTEYADRAIAKLAPGWKRFDLLAEDRGGLRAWDYAPEGRADMARASWVLANDIRAAVQKGTSGGEPNEVVVYSAGGGAHVPAEAIAYLRGQGFAAATLIEHFAVVQHGQHNWWRNTEAEARAITRPYTIALSEQDPNVYGNGMTGPGLKLLVRNGVHLEGDRFGPDFAKATAVAQGLEPFENLRADAVLQPTFDGSDAGSHAFAVDAEALLAAWDTRMLPGDNLPQPGTGRVHLIVNAGETRLRVMYNEFDWRDAVALMNGGPAARAEATAMAAAEPAADVFAFAPDGAAAAVGGAPGRLGVAAVGDADTIDRDGGRSERLVVLLDEASDSIVVKLAGLSTRDGFREAAGLTGYDADGDPVAQVTITGNGATEVGFDRPVVAVGLEAEPWVGRGTAPAGDPDFSLVYLDVV